MYIGICIYIYIYTSLYIYIYIYNMSDFSIVFWGASRFSWLGAQNHPQTTRPDQLQIWAPAGVPKNRFQTPLMVSNISGYLILSVWWFQNVSNIIDFHETWSTFIDLCCFLTYFREGSNHQIWVWYLKNLKNWELIQQRFLGAEMMIKL